MEQGEGAYSPPRPKLFGSRLPATFCSQMYSGKVKPLFLNPNCKGNFNFLINFLFTKPNLIGYRSKPFVLKQNHQNCTTYSNQQVLTKPVLTLYTKNPCPLCDEALETLKPFLDQVILEKIDITAPENKRFWKSYRYDIPVFHLNGKFLMKHRANLDVFNNSLKEYYLQVGTLS